jgi:hypothetical protein
MTSVRALVTNTAGRRQSPLSGGGTSLRIVCGCGHRIYVCWGAVRCVVVEQARLTCSLPRWPGHGTPVVPASWTRGPRQVARTPPPRTTTGAYLAVSRSSSSGAVLAPIPARSLAPMSAICFCCTTHPCWSFPVRLCLLGPVHPCHQGGHGRRRRRVGLCVVLPGCGPGGRWPARWHCDYCDAALWRGPTAHRCHGDPGGCLTAGGSLFVRRTLAPSVPALF